LSLDLPNGDPLSHPSDSSFKSLYSRTTGEALSLGRLKSMEVKEASLLYEHPANCLIAKIQKEHIEQLDHSIGLIEKAVLQPAREHFDAGEPIGIHVDLSGKRTPTTRGTIHYDGSGGAHIVPAPAIAPN